jgi:spore coat assembly protein SafA
MSSVTVRPGDSMWAIAQRNNVTLQSLIDANPQISNPNLIFAGQELEIPGSRDEFEAAPAEEAPVELNPSVPEPEPIDQPPPPAPESELPASTYSVRSGDTLSGIAGRAGVSLADLLRANPDIRNPNIIFPGQQILIPQGGSVPEPRAPVTTGGVTGGDPNANPYYADFVRAAEAAGVPPEWASNPALIQLVRHESGFRPDAKNPTSTAFGMFQFLDSTWASYLREVPYGSQDPYWQAVGGFRYIEQRYGTPERAWAFWQSTVNRDPSIAPPDMRSLSQYWIDHRYAGY